MAYISGNPKTKKEAKEKILGRRAADVLFEPGVGTIPSNGTAYLEGPHYPKPHTWYAVAIVTDGIITKVK